MQATKSMSDDSLISHTPSESKMSRQEHKQHIKTEKNAKCQRVGNYCTTLWFQQCLQNSFHKCNAQQCLENSSPREGALTTEPNPDTTKYHEDEAEIICNVAVALCNICEDGGMRL